MTEISPPAWLQSGSNGARQGRLLATGQIAAGVWTATDLAVTAGSGLNVNVSVGGAYVDLGTGQGKGACYNDASVTRTHAAGGASARTDLVIARVRGSEFGDGADNWTIEIVDGTSGAPAVPATPARSYVLARVAIAASASSVGAITDMRSVAAYGGSLTGASAAVGTLSASGAATVTGLATLNGGLSLPANSNNTVPVLLGGNNRAMTRNFYTMSMTTGIATATVNFGVTFPSVPAVVSSCSNIAGNPIIVNIFGVTTTSFTYRAVQASGTAQTGSVNGIYIAVG